MLVCGLVQEYELRQEYGHSRVFVVFLYSCKNTRRNLVTDSSAAIPLAHSCCTAGGMADSERQPRRAQNRDQAVSPRRPKRPYGIQSHVPLLLCCIVCLVVQQDAIRVAVPVQSGHHDGRSAHAHSPRTQEAKCDSTTVFSCTIELMKVQ